MSRTIVPQVQAADSEAGARASDRGWRADRLLRGACAVSVLVLLAPGGWARPHGLNTRMSVSTAGNEANASSAGSRISAEARHVVFASYARNLVPGDVFGTEDVFVHDRMTRVTSCISLDPLGLPGGGFQPAISGDGRHVAFTTGDDVSGGSNLHFDVAVRDRLTGGIEVVSISSLGIEGDGTSSQPAISLDGRYVAFVSAATNLVPGDTNGRRDVFVRDRQSGETTRVSVHSNGSQGNNDSEHPSLSADGRYVAFESRASNLVSGDSNGKLDVFLHDRLTGETVRVSVSSLGAEANARSEWPALSADGLHIAFGSTATNLVPQWTNGHAHVYVRDLLAGTTHLVSQSSSGVEGDDESRFPSISSDGRQIAFSSFAQNFVLNDFAYPDVFVHDRATGETLRVSVSPSGGTSNDWSELPSISGDGLCVAFESRASNLVPNDTNLARDIFVHDRACSGAVAIYCAPQQNSAGCTPAITTSGTPSAAAGVGFVIGAQNVLAGQSGIFFYGKNGATSLPFNGGTLCAQPPLVRLSVQNAGGTPPCGGSFSLDFNVHAASGKDPGLVPGQTIWGQWWSRDPASPPGNTNLTDAVRATLCP